MTNPSEERPLAKLIKLLNMTTSSNDGEVANAMRLANRILNAELGADWEKLLRGKVTVVEDPFAATPRGGNGHSAPPPPPKAPPPTPSRRPPPRQAPPFDPNDPRNDPRFSTGTAGWTSLSSSVPPYYASSPSPRPSPSAPPHLRPPSSLSAHDLVAEAKTYAATPKQQRWIDDCNSRVSIGASIDQRSRDFLESFIARARRNQGAPPNVNIF